MSHSKFTTSFQFTSATLTMSTIGVVFEGPFAGAVVALSALLATRIFAEAASREGGWPRVVYTVHAMATAAITTNTLLHATGKL